MQIVIYVKAKAKENKVIKKSEDELYIKTTVPAYQNQANLKITEILAQYYNIAKSQIRIISGLKSKIKKIEIKR